MSRDMPPGSSLRARALTLAAEVMQSSVRDVVNVLFRHKRVISGFFVAVVFSVTLYSFVVPEVFRSEAKLLIRVGRENLTVDASAVGGGPTMGMAQSRENEINSELSILTSRVLAEQVVDAAGEDRFLKQPGSFTVKQKLYATVRRPISLSSKILSAASSRPPLSPRERAIAKVLDGITVDVEKKTNIINVAYEDKNPELARDTLAQLIEFYLPQHIKAYSAQASPQFFDEQAKKLEIDLLAKEKQRDAFRAEHGISTVEAQKESLLEQISNTDAQLATTIADISAAQAQLASLDTALKSRSKTVVTSETSGVANVSAERIKASLTDMRLRETDLAARYPENHRPLVELREQIKQAEAMLAKEKETLTTVTTGLDQNYMQLQLDYDTEAANLKAHQARKIVIEGEVARLKEELAELITCEAELNRMDREIDVAEKEYRDYREGSQRARISAAMDLDQVSNVSVIQPATFSPIPVKPRKLRNVALGIFLGLFGGIVVAFTLEYVDDTMHTAEDLEKRLGIPVLSAITNTESKKYIYAMK